MADIITPEQRSKNMRAIKGRNTRPEMAIRKGLHALGLRFRLHDGRMPGKPDIIFPRYKAVVLIHGCFWHGHDCALFKWPKTRPQFWKKKITGNQIRDKKVYEQLTAIGWRVLTVWECAVKGTAKYDQRLLMQKIAKWIKKTEPSADITGEPRI